MWTQTQGRRQLGDSGDSDWGYAAVSQGMARITGGTRS